MESSGEGREVRARKRRGNRGALPAHLPLRAKLALISQKGKLADAIRYALSRWEGLTRFIDDGRIELDNNVVERSIRRSRSTGKMHCLQVLTAVPSTGPSSPP